MEDIADPSLAARLDASRLGTAMAMMMPMIATTMSSSIRENPTSFFLLILIPQKLRGMETNSIPLTPSLGCGRLLVAERTESIACTPVGYSCHAWRTSHYTVFGDAELTCARLGN